MIEFLKKQKTKIIIIVAVASVLTAAFFLGENPAPTVNENSVALMEVSEKISVYKSENSIGREELSKENNKTESSDNIIKESSFEELSDVQESSLVIENNELSQQSQILSITSKTEESNVVSKNHNSIIQNSVLESSIEVSSNINPESTVSSIETSKENSKEKEELTCTISISCAAILNNTDKLDSSKKALVPSNGCILQETDVEYSEDESAFDILKKICMEQKIHLEFSQTPLYNSVYIEGINNIYEFDCGSMSGWIYRVNGNYYNYSCSEYTVNDGDKIEFLYTCDLGKDIGENNF